MIDETTHEELPVRRQVGLMTDAVVVIAMTLVAVAVAIGLTLHLDLPQGRAAVAGAMILALMLGMHFVILRSGKSRREAPDLSDEAMWQALKARRTDSAAAVPTEAPGETAANDGGLSSRKSKIVAPKFVVDNEPKRGTAPSDATAVAGHSEDKLDRAAEAGGAPPRGRQWRERIAAGLRGSLSEGPEGKSTEATVSPADQHGLEDGFEIGEFEPSHQDFGSYWSYRPSGEAPATPEPSLSGPSLSMPDDGSTPAPATTDARSTDAEQAGSQAAGPATPPPLALDDTAPAEPAPSVSPRQHDVEMVQRMIKKLAEDVNAAELMAMRSLDSQGQATGGGQKSSPPPVAGVESSLSALRATSAMMRAEPPAPLASKPIGELLGRNNPRYRRINELNAAIDENRLAVLLEPVMGLEDHRARHYEITVKVQSSGGAQLQDEAANQEFAGTGLLARFDRERLAKTKSVAATLKQRGKTGGLFSSMFGESLTDREFCFNVAANGISDESFARRLIMTFPQSVARNFAPAQWQTLHEFRELGFRFALSDVTDLDIDFERLVAAGFAFAKLDAEVFFNGLHLSEEGFVPAADICGYLSQLGLSLIVEGVDSSETLSRLYDNGVLFGQGQLFGGPRTIKAEALAGNNHEAA